MRFSLLIKTKIFFLLSYIYVCIYIYVYDLCIILSLVVGWILFIWCEYQLSALHSV